MVKQTSEEQIKNEEYRRVYYAVMGISNDSTPMQIANSHTYRGLNNVLKIARQIPPEFLKTKSDRENRAFLRNLPKLESTFDISRAERFISRDEDFTLHLDRK